MKNRRICLKSVFKNLLHVEEKVSSMFVIGYLFNKSQFDICD